MCYFCYNYKLKVTSFIAIIAILFIVTAAQQYPLKIQQQQQPQQKQSNSNVAQLNAFESENDLKPSASFGHGYYGGYGGIGGYSGYGIYGGYGGYGLNKYYTSYPYVHSYSYPYYSSIGGYYGKSKWFINLN